MRLRSANICHVRLVCLVAVLLLLAPGVTYAKDQASSQLAFGVDMAKRGLWKEALFRFQKAEKLEPENPRIQSNLGVAAEAAGQFDKALEYYQNVTTQFGSSYQAQMALFHQARLTEAKGQLKEAQQLFESVVKRYPESVAAGVAGREAGRLTDKLSQEIPKPAAEKTASPGASPSAAKLPQP